uniref:Exonuclease domain-containing protein n=1 Tax=Magallana gigas TaxID=29159 RepID=K1P7X5_MAGGI
MLKMRKWREKLNNRCQMTPGRFTVKYTTKLANSLKRKRLLQAQCIAKQRRLELKSERLSKEGESYSTNIGFDECTDTEDITIPSKEFSVDSRSLIVFDLETTGLGRTTEAESKY